MRRHEFEVEVGSVIVVADQELTVVEITAAGEVVLAVRPAATAAVLEEVGEPMLAR